MPSRDDAQRLEDASASARIVSYYCESASGHTLRSPNCTALLGLPTHGPTEAWSALIDPEDLPYFENALHSTTPANPDFEVEYRIAHAATRRRMWVLDRGTCEFGPDGHKLSVRGAIVDISDRIGAEMAMRQSAQMSAVAFEAARMATWHLDMATNVFTCTDELLRLLGTDKGQFGGTPQALEKFIHPADTETWRSFYRMAFAISGRHEVEFRVLRPNGAVRWILTRGEISRRSDGTVREAFGIMMDITERKSSEEAAARLAAIVTHSEEAILSKTLSGIVTSWNRGAETLFGYTAAEMIGEPVMKIVPVENAGEEARILSTISRGETIAPYESVRLRKDGTRVHVSVAVSPIRNAAGQAVGCSTIARDITERRRYTEIVRQNEARLRLALRSARAGAWDIDLVRDHLHWTPEMFVIYGHDPARGVPSREARDSQIDPAHRSRVKRQFDQALEAGGSFALEFPITRPDGSLIWTSVVGDVVKDENGLAIGARGIDQDITERKNWEKRQAMLLKELSHRVKNTLAVIQSMTRQTLRSNSDPEKFVTAFEGRIRSLAASHSLLTDVDWKGAGLVDILRSQLEGMVDSMDESFTLRGPDVTVPAGAATQLGLVLHELGTNASKYGALSRPGGHIDIVWTLYGNKLRLSWRERGGPRVTGTSREEGFGTSLLLSSADKVTRRFLRNGFSCRLEFML